MKLILVTLLFNFIVSFSYSVHDYLGKTTCNLLANNSKIVYDKINNIFTTDCGEASIWADRVKRNSKYSWTKKLHYIKITECSVDTRNLMEYCKNKECIVFALINFINDLKVNNFTLLTKEETLKMVFHLIQDFSQPLHLYGNYSGGNGFKIIRNKNGRNKTTNLHSFYDKELIDHFLKESNYTPSFNYSKNVQNIDSFVYSMIPDILLTACDIYTQISSTQYIIFEDFYNENKEKISENFDRYFYFAMTILNNIYNNNDTFFKIMKINYREFYLK